MKAKSFLLAASMVLAMAFTLSCSSDDNSGKQQYVYCVYPDEGICVTGPVAECRSGGLLKDECPNGFSKGNEKSSSSDGSRLSSSSSDNVHVNLCANGPSVECLVGTWEFEGVVGVDGNLVSSYLGSLRLFADGFYEFVAGDTDYFVSGIWSVEGNILIIHCDEIEETLSGTITFNGENAMSIKSTAQKAVISLFMSANVLNPTEKFTRR